MSNAVPQQHTEFYLHQLRGCASRPLASYLKALGLLRIVAEQADSGARGYWTDEGFVLVTTLDEETLFGFFLHDWRPSPFVSPWNKGSGLLGDDPKGVRPLQTSVAPRFEDVRAGIAQAKALTAEMERAVAEEKAIKAEANGIKDAVARQALREDPVYKQRLARAAKACKRLKDEIQPECQLRWRGPALRWLRAAVVLAADGSAVFPALLGTGGNDGKLDFTNNAMQRLGDLFDLGSMDGAPRPEAEGLLRASLFGEPVAGMVKGGIGQFAPSASGGANATAGALGGSYLNPWDLPLLLEGALLFTASTSRRLGAAASERTVAPFSSRSWSSGYGSASGADESARGEQWMPLWSRPWTAHEVAALLAEGRCRVGGRPSDTSMDVARSIARLGVARGVSAFERYGYIERNGMSNYAVPLGRWEVRAVPGANLFDDLEAGGWWSRLRRSLGDKNAPASLVALERRFGDLVMATLQHEGEGARWQSVLVTLAQIEAQLVASGAFTASKRIGPIPRLSPGWVTAAQTPGSELSLALALAGAGAGHSRAGWPADSVRHHWLPLDRFGKFAVRERGLAADPRVVMAGRSAESDLVALLLRRLTEGDAGASRRLSLRAAPGASARVDDVLALVSGDVDLDQTVWLARALAALKWDEFAADVHIPRAHQAPREPDMLWAALRLCHLAGPLPDGRQVPVEPSILRSLASGDAPRAFATVAHRLRAAGVLVPFTAATLEPDVARRFAASMAFPISSASLERLVQLLHPTVKKESIHVR